MFKKENLLKICKYALLLLSMYICLPMGVFAYGGGFATHIMILIFALFLAWVGYAATSKTLGMLFLHINLLVSVYLGSSYAAKLYCAKVSSDQMSFIIGNAFTYIVSGLTLVAVIVLLTIRSVAVAKKRAVKGA